jgi:hypothetical protein
MQRVHTLGIAFLILNLGFVAACGDDDDDDTSADSGSQPGKDSGAPDGKDSGTPNGKDAAVAEDASSATPDDDAGTGGGAIEVAGDWHGEFADEVIDAMTWNGAKLIEFDNEKNFAITQYPADDMYNPNKFARVVWTQPTDDGFYYCSIEYSVDTLKEAQESTKTADDSDPANGGCSDMDFPWTKLEPK